MVNGFQVEIRASSILVPFPNFMQALYAFTFTLKASVSVYARSHLANRAIPVRFLRLRFLENEQLEFVLAIANEPIGVAVVLSAKRKGHQ
jgi:hypothetical protein